MIEIGEKICERDNSGAASGTRAGSITSRGTACTRCGRSMRSRDVNVAVVQRCCESRVNHWAEMGLSKGDVCVIYEYEGVVEESDCPPSRGADDQLITDIYCLTGNVTEIVDDDSGNLALSVWENAYGRADTNVWPRLIIGRIIISRLLHDSCASSPKPLLKRQFNRIGAANRTVFLWRPAAYVQLVGAVMRSACSVRSPQQSQISLIACSGASFLLAVKWQR